MRGLSNLSKMPSILVALIDAHDLWDCPPHKGTGKFASPLSSGAPEDWQTYQTSEWIYHLLTLITTEDVKNLLLIACFCFLFNI